MKIFNSKRIYFLFQKPLLLPGIPSRPFHRCFSTVASSPDSGEQAKAPENPEEQQPKKTKKIYRFSMSPHAYWLLRGRGMERPYTGDYWCTKETGHYVCLGCSNKLFLSEHKFFPPTGMASFWMHIPKAVETVADVENVQENFTNILDSKQTQPQQKQRCTCAKCKSHLGLVYLDGPAPTFLRFSINSGGIKFIEKPFFENPLRIKERRNKAKMSKKMKEEKAKFPDFPFDKKKYYEIAKK